MFVSLLLKSRKRTSTALCKINLKKFGAEEAPEGYKSRTSQQYHATEEGIVH